MEQEANKQNWLARVLSNMQQSNQQPVQQSGGNLSNQGGGLSSNNGSMKDPSLTSDEINKIFDPLGRGLGNWLGLGENTPKATGGTGAEQGATNVMNTAGSLASVLSMFL